MKALFIYNPISGHHLVKNKLKYIYQELEPIYEKFEVIASTSDVHFKNTILEKAENYDILLISGGDGTVNMAINVIAKLDKKPILGLIPLGTINDCAKNYGIPAKFKKAVAVIKKGQTKQVDIFKCNDRYVGYVATFGAYSDIPYVSANKTKKIFGRLAYYFIAVPRLFKRYRIEGKIILKDKTIDFITPFLMVMNGNRMGGFRINKKAVINDGLADIVYSDPGIFNSLPRYFLARKKLKHIQADEFRIEIPDYMWDLDGEKGPIGSVIIKVLHNFIDILA